MAKEIEYWGAVDKSTWGEGAWQEEPDKAQWVDAATGLSCLIVRGPVGALCGYVGVAQGHPLYGKEYGECTLPQKCGESYCEHSAEMNLRVHGGITFAKSCAVSSRETWEEHRKHFGKAISEARKHPHGDSAEYVRTWKGVIHDYDQWKALFEAHTICHIAAEGEPDHLWWFGFDCAHCDDKAPKVYPSLGRDTILSRGIYRDLAYVREECTELAAQLASVVPMMAPALPAPS